MPATCALALFVVLGLVFDWWEQPPFGIVVGLLVGLAIAQPSEPRSARRKVRHPLVWQRRDGHAHVARGARRNDGSVIPGDAEVGAC